MKIFLFLCAFLFLMNPVTGQNENPRKISGTDEKYSLVWVGIESGTTAYINTNTKDSSGAALYLAPYFNYSHKSGLGISAGSYILPGGTNPGFYLTSISPFYANYSGKIYPYVAYTRYIQHDNPSVPYSPIQNEFYAHARINTKYLDVITGVDYGFGKDEENNNESANDINVFAGISHLFAWYELGANKNNAIGVFPSLQVNAGTDRYFKYLRESKYIYQNTNPNQMGYGRGNGRNGNGSQGGNPGTQNSNNTISEENNFALSNIELNLYVMYFFGKFSIEPSGSMFFPLRGEDKNPYGYWQLNLNYWIK